LTGAREIIFEPARKMFHGRAEEEDMVKGFKLIIDGPW
jgi:hypothetical protein